MMEGLVDIGNLDFMVKTTCDVLDIEFTGTTQDEKQAFVQKHLKQRNEAINQILNEEFHKMMEQAK